MTTTETITRPRVTLLAVVILVRGILTMTISAVVLSQINQYPDYFMPGLAPFHIFLMIPVSIVELISAVMIMRYKRNGLILGGAGILLELLAIPIMSIAFQNQPNSFSLVISLAILFFIGRYLIAEPSRSFFT